MYRPPHSPGSPALDRATWHRRPTWRSILVSYATIAAIPILLWVVSEPLTGAAVLAAVVGLSIGARRAHRLVRCFHDCRALTFDLGGEVRITVAQPPTDEPT